MDYPFRGYLIEIGRQPKHGYFYELNHQDQRFTSSFYKNLTDALIAGCKHVDGLIASNELKKK